MFLPTDSGKKVMLLKTDTFKRHSFCPPEPCEEGGIAIKGREVKCRKVSK